MSIQKYLESKLNKNVVSIIKDFDHVSKKRWEKKMDRVIAQLENRTRGLEENIDNYQDWGRYNKWEKWTYHRCTLKRCSGHWMVGNFDLTIKVIGKYGIDKGKIIKMNVCYEEKLERLCDELKI